MKHQGFNKDQKQVIWDALSLARPALFATTNNRSLRWAKTDNPLQSLKDRAFRVFPKEEAIAIFASNRDGKTDDDLLQKYRDISALPTRERKAAFRRESARDKSNLWKTHMALYLVRRPDLNEAQRETILVGISLATPQLFEVNFAEAEWQAAVGESLRSLERRIVDVFSKEEGAQVFAALGDTEPSASACPSENSPSLRKANYVTTSILCLTVFRSGIAWWDKNSSRNTPTIAFAPAYRIGAPIIAVGVVVTISRADAERYGAIPVMERRAIFGRKI